MQRLKRERLLVTENEKNHLMVVYLQEKEMGERATRKGFDGSLEVSLYVARRKTL